MLPLDVKKEVEALNALMAALTAIHDAALEVLHQLRCNQGKCVQCGDYLVVSGEDYCIACFDAEMTRIMAERKNPDEREVI